MPSSVPPVPKSAQPVSPVSVTVGAVEHSVDFIRPHLRARAAGRVALYAGVQINGAPHLGTSVMQTAAFLLAEAARDRFGVPAELRFGALDNAPYETRVCPRTGTQYTRSYHHAVGPARIEELVKRFYGGLFDALSAATGVPYTVETYTQQQQVPVFRAEFLASLASWGLLRWTLAPSSGHVPVSFPCPRCGWLQKHGEGTELLAADMRPGPVHRRLPRPWMLRGRGAAGRGHVRRTHHAAPQRRQGTAGRPGRRAARHRQGRGLGGGLPPAGRGLSLLSGQRSSMRPVSSRPSSCPRPVPSCPSP